VDRDRYQQEAQRLAAILREEIRSQGVSIRSLEQKMGVGNSVYQKVLCGKITMTVGHLLQIADALGLDWLELFRRAYLGPLPLAEVPAVPAMAGIDDLEARVLEILHRHGVLPDAPPEDSGSTRTEPARSAGPDAMAAAPETAAPARSWPR
jgi:transcriptional regulator with XRE-family HTH domain